MKIQLESIIIVLMHVYYNKYKLHIIFYGGNARRRSLKRPHPLKRVRNCIEEHNTKIKTTKISVDSTLLS